MVGLGAAKMVGLLVVVMVGLAGTGGDDGDSGDDGDEDCGGGLRAVVSASSDDDMES